MTTTTVSNPMTPEELLRMRDNKWFELAGGRLIERKSSWICSALVVRLSSFVMDYLDAHSVGWATGSNAGYACFPDDPNKVRRPSFSVIRNERMPLHEVLDGWCPVAPDLAVEVVTPQHHELEIDEKAREFIEVGTRLVWAVQYRQKTIRVHRPDGTVTDLQSGDVLDGENVLPGFRVPVAELFK